MYNQGRHTGWIEVVCGPMFSGKTEELIRRLRLAVIARQKAQIFKHSIDARYEDTYIASHSDQKFKAHPVQNSAQIMDAIIDGVNVVGIDEAQFFDDGIIDVCDKLADRGIRVIAVGLDQDFKGQPFGPIAALLAKAESVLKLKAVCMCCGGHATKSQRLTAEGDRVVVGSGEMYEARCRACFDPDLMVEKNMPAKPKSRWPKKEDKAEEQTTT